MPHFRKKPSSSTRSTGGPPPTPTPPVVEPVNKHPKVKDIRVLAASANASDSSIASTSYGHTDSALDEPGSSKKPRWKTAYEAARIAIDVANASSDMCLPLKAVVGALSVLIKNYDQTTDNTDQIKGIEGRVLFLGEKLASPVDDQDDKEKARRDALHKKLTCVIMSLGPLSKQGDIKKFLKNAVNSKTLNGIVQDLATAVTDYQTSIQQDIYVNTKRITEDTRNIHENTKNIGEDVQKVYQNTSKIDEDVQNIIGATKLQLLRQLNPVHDAGYQAGHHDTCLPGTRKSVLDGMMGWAKKPQQRRVLWLNGLAGTGKSTIAQTFSEMVARDGTLGASFFCSRDYHNRKELKKIFPTLAYQLAFRYPAFREQIIPVIEKDPSIASNSLISQLKDLIVDPLSSTNISCVIVVDALDECIDNQPASAILSVLGRHVKNLPHQQHGNFLFQRFNHTYFKKSGK